MCLHSTGAASSGAPCQHSFVYLNAMLIARRRRGWCIVGKKETCPVCWEKVCCGALASAGWSVHDLHRLSQWSGALNTPCQSGVRPLVLNRPCRWTPNACLLISRACTIALLLLSPQVDTKSVFADKPWETRNLSWCARQLGTTNENAQHTTSPHAAACTQAHCSLQTCA